MHLSIRAAVVVSMVILGGCAAPPAEQPAAIGMVTPLAPARAAANDPPRYAQGCLGRTLNACLENVKGFYSIADSSELQREIAANERKDVNGNPVMRRKMLSIFGYMRGFSRHSMIEATYNDSRVITNIEIILPDDPSLASTEEEYDRTGLYPAIQLLIGSSCPEARDKLAAYRFFQNTVMPRIIRERKKIELHAASAETSYFSKAIGIPFCGRRFFYTNLFGNNTDDITLENPEGAFMQSTISFR